MLAEVVEARAARLLGFPVDDPGIGDDREDPLTAGLPVVLMTARVQLYEQSRPPPGVQAIIAKPFDPVSLASRLQAIWDRVEPG